MNSYATSASYGVDPRDLAAFLGVKEPAAFRPYSVCASDVFPGSALETDLLVLLSLASQPSGDGELLAFDLAYDRVTNRVGFWLIGGVPGRFYILNLLGETAAGIVHQALLRVDCDPLLATYPTPTPPNPGLGEPIMWPCGTTSFGPAKNLPAFTVAATGTTQLTAAQVPELAITLINAGTGTVVDGAAGCVQLIVPIAQWNGYRPVFANRSGNPVELFLYGSDAFESLSPGAGLIIQNEQSVTLSASLGGAAIVS